MDYWQDYPPVHILLGRLLNANPRPSRSGKTDAAPSREQLVQLAQAFKGGVVTK